jgi:hypothetical protein
MRKRAVVKEVAVNVGTVCRSHTILK